MASLFIHGRGKLGPKYFGPFKVLDRVGDMAYRLQLPLGTRLHNVFHVGLLKPFQGTPPETTPVLPPIHHGRVCLVPERVLKGRQVRGLQEVLVQWQGHQAAEASWMPLDEFRCVYPSFQLEDELIVQAGRDVMYGRHYTRCHNKQVQ